MEVVFSIKYGWNVASERIRHLRLLVQNSLGERVHTSCKISNFYRHFAATKTHVDKIFGIRFFNLKRQSYRLLPGKKSSWARIIFIHKPFNEIFDKIVKQPKKQDKYEILYFLGSCISLLLQIASSSFQSSQCSKKQYRLNKNQSSVYFVKPIKAVVWVEIMHLRR